MDGAAVSITNARISAATLRVCEKIRSWFDTLTTNGML